MLGMSMTKAEAGEAFEALKALKSHDTAYWLFRINEASVVGNVRRGLLTTELARTIREALAAMESDADEGRWTRPELYITFEPELLKRTGMPASVLLHCCGVNACRCCGLGAGACGCTSAGSIVRAAAAFSSTTASYF